MKRNFFWLGAFLTMVLTMFAEQPSPSTRGGNFDVIIRNGTVYDGTGAEPRQADVAIRGDRIAGVGDFKSAKANTVIDAKGLAVAPGFINMLSWSTESLIQDGRSQSEIRQGVTTEIMGEGESMGPVNDRVREHKIREQTDIKYDIPWNTLAEYLQHLQKRGVSCNVASFIGATTIREYVIGYEDKQPTPEQLDEMRGARAERNGSRRTRDRHFTDLSARVLCENRRADRAVQGRGKISGQIHFAYAQRRKSTVRSA